MPTDRTRLPLPEPTPGCWWDKEAIDAMHAYSDAECAPLMKEIEALRQGGSKLTAETAALRERVKVLEDALGEISWSNNSKWQSDRADAALNARAALEKTS